MRRLRALAGKRLYVSGLCLALVLLVGADAFAQGRQTGTLRGQAVDSTGAILPGVTVTATAVATDASRTAQTDLNGNYEISGLPNGTYTVSYALQGFTTVENSVEIGVGTLLESNVTMPVGAVAEAVQVTAVVPSPLASTEISHSITADEWERCRWAARCSGSPSWLPA